MGKEPQHRDLRNHFEAIVGHEIGELEENVYALRERIAVWSEEAGTPHVTSREIGTTGSSTKACGDMRVLFVGGQTVTNSSGKAEFLLSDYHCLPVERPLVTIPDFPIIFVATAQTSEPVFVTSRAVEQRTPEGGIIDVRVEIYTWSPNGSPAKLKLVKWFCRLPFTQIVLPS